MRKTKDITIEAECRDKGKTFRITEMDADKAERWAIRAGSAMARAGVEIGNDIAEMGMIGIFVAGFRSIMSMAFEDAEPLLNEMMGCVQIIPGPNVVRPLITDDIEEVSTRLFLRAEVADLHTGFSVIAYLSPLGAAFKEMANTKLRPMSPPPSPPLSARGKRPSSNSKETTA